MKRDVFFAVVLILAAMNAEAFQGACGMGPGMGLPYHWAAGLDLTDDQRARIQAKQDAFMEEVSPLRDRLFSRKMELRELWGQAGPDQAKISAKQREIQAIQNQIQDKATRYRIECLELLSPEQQERLGTFAARHGGWGSIEGGMHGR